MRLLAALMVFHGHAFALAGRGQPRLAGSLAIGGVAVSVFFVMSGYLVTKSALRRSLMSYAVARAIRIWPGLVVCCAVSIGLGALVTTIPVAHYLSHPQTVSYLRNAFVFWTEMQADLPGVFEGRPHTAMNGSLWTLRYEVFCYVALACAAVFGPKGVLVTIAAVGVFAIAVLFGRPSQGGITMLDYFEFRWMALLGGAFFLGALLNWLDRPKLPRLIAVSLFAMLLVYRDPLLRQIAGTFLYGSAALWVCLNLNLDQKITRGTDLSYGIYIYAFPCQQIATQFFVDGKSGFNSAYITSLLATLVLACLSWFLVERPILRQKDRLSRASEKLSVAGQWLQRILRCWFRQRRHASLPFAAISNRSRPMPPSAE
jgi:peptidoglycan/LPS O-acetylase OafA/YrhL